MGSSATEQFSLGSLVRVRDCEWVVMPSEDPDVLNLKPLSVREAETCGILLPLAREEIKHAWFQPPHPQSEAEFIAGWLLRDATRLNCHV